MQFAARSLIVFAVLAAAPFAQAQQKNNPFLESLGALAAAQLYTTHAYIGVTGDAFVAKAYKAKQVRAQMTETAGMIDNVSRYLVKAAGEHITPEDKLFLQEAVGIFGLLKQQALALKSYAGTGQKTDAEAYQAQRQAAWSRIKKLLNIK
ncbi:MAG: hypothetical protein ACI9OJ_002848 [Myxococcota bacterium]|jgi:hypothetical protein